MEVRGAEDFAGLRIGVDMIDASTAMVGVLSAKFRDFKLDSVLFREFLDICSFDGQFFLHFVNLPILDRFLMNCKRNRLFFG